MPLILLRHAKAAPAGGGLRDIDRTLDERGLRQADALAADLAPLIGDASAHIVSSTAVRTQQTIAPLAAALGVEVRTDGSLYAAEPAAWAEVVDSESGLADWLIVVGHQPTVSQVASAACEERTGAACPIDSFPPATAVVLDGPGGPCEVRSAAAVLR